MRIREVDDTLLPHSKLIQIGLSSDDGPRILELFHYSGRERA